MIDETLKSVKITAESAIIFYLSYIANIYHSSLLSSNKSNSAAGSVQVETNLQEELSVHLLYKKTIKLLKQEVFQQ